MKVLQHVLAFWIAIAICLGIWWAIGTSFFFSPGQITYLQTEDRGYVGYWERDYPWGFVPMTWATRCRSELSPVWKFATGKTWEPVPEHGMSYFEASKAMTECIDTGIPVRAEHEWQAWLFGIWPLRPVGIAYTIAVPPTRVSDARLAEIAQEIGR